MHAAIVAEIIGPDLLIVLVLVALLFGGARLPKLARSLGSAKSEFEKGVREGREPTAATAAQPAPTPEPSAETVTLTLAELDALVADREARARQGGERLPPQA